MSEPSKPERPRQVTVAAALIMGGSLIVVATVFERISGLHTIETQESVQRFLSEPPGDGLGLEVDGVLTILRTLAMVAGGCATAAAILGYQVLQRSKSARIALSVLAVPLFVTGIAAGGFMSSIVVAAAVMLWFQPARDWFDGTARKAPDPATRAARGAGASTTGTRIDTTAPTPPTPPAPPAAPTPTPTPRAVPGFGTVVVGEPHAPGLPADRRTDRDARPGAVVWACALVWACCSLAVVAMTVSTLVFLVSPDLVLDELRRQNPDLGEQAVTDSAIATAVYVTAAVVIAWSIAAIVVAALAYRRVGWARVALLASASVAAMFCLIATVGNFLLALPLAACVATVVLLLRPDVRAWFARRGSVSL